MCLCIAAWCLLCLTYLSRLICAQQSQARAVFQQCYNLADSTHCFMTDKNDLVKTFDEADAWCKNEGSALVRVDSPEVQTAVEQFLREFELTSDDVWIGAKRSTQGLWIWVNGSVYTDGSYLHAYDLLVANHSYPVLRR